jgi:hypothetical protein
MWGGQGSYKDCRATGDGGGGDYDDIKGKYILTVSYKPVCFTAM